MPSKKIKTENSSAHSDLSTQQPPNNHQEKEDAEPPVDFSTTNPTKSASRKQESSESSPGWDREKEDTHPVKPEPVEGGGGPGGGGGGEPEDSNESAVVSEPQIVTTEPDDSAHSGHQQNYFDNKLVPFASFNFSMAAALAADSLAGLFCVLLFCFNICRYRMLPSIRAYN